MAVAGGGYLELYRNNVTWDLSRDRGALQMWVYAKSAEVGASADPWNIHLGICLSNDSGFSSYYTAVSNRQVHEGWNLLRFSTADWVASGSASWSRPVSRMLMYCSSPGSRSVELSFDELRSGVRGVMPAFMWRFDDGYDEVYQDVLPYLSGLGQKGTMYLRTDSVGTGGRYITLPHLQALYDAGWALGNHTSDHTDLTTVDQATAAAKISAGTSWLLSHGFPRAAYHLAYPYDFTNATARAAAAQSGILSATRAGSVNQQLPVDDPLYLNSFPMSGGTSDFAAWKAAIDKAVDSGGTMIIGCHDFTSIYQNETLPLFRQIADYVAQQRLWTPTIDEWWDTLQMQAQAGSAGAGPWLYVACDAGIQVVDLPDPTTPVLAGGLAAAGAADVDAYDAGACVAVEGVGLQVVGVPDPGSPTLAGSLSTGSAWSSGICVRGARTYVAAGADGLRIVSTADPAHPVLLGTLDTPGDARDVTVVGSKAYLADGQAGIQVIDVSDPSRPALVATHDLSAAANALVVFGHNAYVATDQGTLRVVSLPTGE
jgi:peptidoglycan/xylan/chitin deacetylase (PgdA/CDA1 family)